MTVTDREIGVTVEHFVACVRKVFFDTWLRSAAEQRPHWPAEATEAERADAEGVTWDSQLSVPVADLPAEGSKAWFLLAGRARLMAEKAAFLPKKLARKALGIEPYGPNRNPSLAGARRFGPWEPDLEVGRDGESVTIRVSVRGVGILAA